MWVESNTLEVYESCFSESIPEMDTLTAEQKKVMQERYTMIVSVMSVVGNGQKRSEVISSIAETYDVSKQTVRKYFCQYLSAMDITALVPKSQSSEQPLTKDEKNMCWALNKYCYTQHKNSLKTAYILQNLFRYIFVKSECNNQAAFYCKKTMLGTDGGRKGLSYFKITIKTDRGILKRRTRSMFIG